MRYAAIFDQLDFTFFVYYSAKYQVNCTVNTYVTCFKQEHLQWEAHALYPSRNLHVLVFIQSKSNHLHTMIRSHTLAKRFVTREFAILENKFE